MTQQVEDSTKPECETPEVVVAPAPAPVTETTQDKAIVPVTPPPEDKPDESKALAIVQNKVLERVATEKRLSLIRAWEESEKSKAENKAQKNLSAVGSWENSRKATIEADLKKIEEKLEKKKAVYVEQLKNKIAAIHKAAEEKRAMIEAKQGEDLLLAEEKAAKYRATGTGPKKLFGCF
ncbi:hypothetical protein AgCh_013464 [Apium graveolens]